MEDKMSYQDIEKRLAAFGSIKNIAKNPNMIRTILTSNIDRHIVCALFEKINTAVEAGKLKYEDLSYFRDGYLADDIINLDKLVSIYNSRELFPSEILDKLNYISLINDEATLAANYTHPEIINALCGKSKKNVRELTWWATCGTYSTLPSKVQQRVMLSVMEKGDYETAKNLCEAACYHMPTSKLEERKFDELMIH